MPIRTTCPSCRTVYSLADHYAGKTVRCKQCEAAIVVRAAKGRAGNDQDESNSGAREQIQTRPRAASPAERERPVRTRPRRREREDDWDSEDSLQHSNRGLVIGLIAAAAVLVLLLGGGIVVVVLLSRRSDIGAPAAVAGVEEPLNGDAVSRALQQLKSADPNKRREAARKLKDMLPDERRAEVFKALEPLLNDTDIFTRKFATEAIGVWANKDAVPILLKAMQDRDTRHEAMKALGRLKDERAAEPIAARLEVLMDMHSAEEALIQMGPIAEKSVLARLNSADVHVRMTVCRILDEIGTKQSIPALEKVIAAGKDPFSGLNHLVAMRAEQTIRVIKARR